MRRKKEKITIAISEMPTDKTSFLEKGIELYTELPVREHNPLNDYPTYRGKIEKIINDYGSVLTQNEESIKKYYILKIFSKTVRKDESYNETILTLDRDINNLKRNSEDIKKRIKKLEIPQLEKNEELEGLFFKTNDFISQSRDLKKVLTDIQNKYYKELKMTSFSICKLKSLKELEELWSGLNELLEEYKTVERAYDYIYYNSGDEIVSTVNAFIKLLESTGSVNIIENHPTSYFLKADFVMTLEYHEWVELFNKFRYVLRIIRNYDRIRLLEFASKYKELEKKYFVVLLMNEITSRKN